MVAINAIANGMTISVHELGSTVFRGIRGRVANTAIMVAEEITVSDRINGIPFLGANDPNAAMPKSIARPIDGIKINAGKLAKSLARSIGWMS